MFCGVGRDHPSSGSEPVCRCSFLRWLEAERVGAGNGLCFLCEGSAAPSGSEERMM